MDGLCNPCRLAGFRTAILAEILVSLDRRYDELQDDVDDDEEETLEDLNRLLADTKAANARVDDEDGKPLVPIEPLRGQRAIIGERFTRHPAFECDTFL